MKLEDETFDKDKYIKHLETLVYLMLAFPLLAFGYVLLEKEASNELRSVVMENPDWLFHGAMAMGVAFVLYRTVIGWGQQIRKYVEREKYIDARLKMLKSHCFTATYFGFSVLLLAFMACMKREICYMP